ncbi:hypothetical protein KCU93_g3577, partial [Aureobasidium melanogenum]
MTSPLHPPRPADTPDPYHELNVAKSAFDYSVRQVARAQIDYGDSMALNKHTAALTHLREMSLETLKLAGELAAGCRRIETLEEHWRKQISQLASQDHTTMTVMQNLTSTMTASILENRNLQEQVEDDRNRIANLQERVRVERDERLADSEKMEYLNIELAALRVSLDEQKRDAVMTAEERLTQQRQELQGSWQDEKDKLEQQVKDLQHDLEQRQTFLTIMDKKQQQLDILCRELGSVRKECNQLKARNAQLEGKNGFGMRKKVAEGVRRASEHLENGARKFSSGMRSASPSFTIGRLSIRKRRPSRT